MLLRAVLRQCCWTSRDDWVGSVAGMHQLTLKFADDGRELGFLKNRSKRLINNLHYASVAAVLVLGVLLALVQSDPRWTLSGAFDHEHLEEKTVAVVAYMVPTIAHHCFILTMLIVVIMTKFPRILNRVSPVYKEMVVVALGRQTYVFSALCVILTILSSRLYVSNMFGYDSYDLWGVRQSDLDSPVALSLANTVCAFHSVIPVRWRALVVLEVFVMLIWGFCDFLFWIFRSWIGCAELCYILHLGLFFWTWKT
jgi:hypothetical protein